MQLYARLRSNFFLVYCEFRFVLTKCYLTPMFTSDFRLFTSHFQYCLACTVVLVNLFLLFNRRWTPKVNTYTSTDLYASITYHTNYKT
jgi:hypothetical protein